MRPLLEALLATMAALALTFASSVAMAALGLPGDGYISTLLMFSWLVVVFHYQQERARGRAHRMKPPVAKAEER